MKIRCWLIKPLLILLLMLPAWLLANEEYVTLEDGSSIKVFMFYPKDQQDDPRPLCVLMPGGPANEYVARAQFWLGKELAERGWVIAVPVSPDATPFFGENARKIPQVIDHLKQSPRISAGKTLLVGVSNGGSSAIEIAGNDPDRYLGVVAVPGILKKSADLGPMNGLPVYIRIGGNDHLRWHRHMPALVEALTGAGARVDAAIIPRARHVFQLNWDELEPWLASLEQH
jgi:predicted esterase